MVGNMPWTNKLSDVIARICIKNSGAQSKCVGEVTAVSLCTDQVFSKVIVDS